MTGGPVAGPGLAVEARRSGVALQPGTLLQSRSLTSRLLDGAAEVLGLAVLAAGLAAAVALVYRWYARERVPGGLAALVGLSAVVVYLNSTRALGQVIGNTGDPLDETVALVNIVTVVLSLAATRAGADLGDHVARDVVEDTATRVDGEVSRVVQAVGRVITVDLPEDIEDVVGYDPVPDETKAKLAGRSFVFPRRLTVAELRDRLVTRLKADYAVGHVDVELADDGTVEYLALGSRAAGIGPTLPPETAAVAVRADPAFAASAGDLVQVWESRPPERVCTAEVRGRAGDVVTLAVDAGDTRRLDDETEYRLVTLPVEARPEREFASLLRAADETMAAVTVADGSPLAGQPLGALDATVVAVRPTEGPVEPLPARDRALAPGDTLYLVATPEVVRRVDGAVRSSAAATGPGESLAPSPGSAMPPERRVDAATPVAGDADGRTAVADAAETDRGATSGADGDSARGGTRSTAGTEPDERERPPRPDPDARATETERDDGSGADASPPESDEDPDAEPSGDDADEATDAGDADDADVADVRGDRGGDHDGGTDADTDDGADAFDLGDPDLPSVGEADAETDGETVGGGDGDDPATGGDGAASDDGFEWTDVTTEGPASAEPTTEDLADLPGTDPDELAGTDVDPGGSGETSVDRVEPDASSADRPDDRAGGDGPADADDAPDGSNDDASERGSGDGGPDRNAEGGPDRDDAQ